MGVYNKASMQFGRAYVKRNPVIMGDKSDGSINTTGNLTFTNAYNTNLIKQYNNVIINSGHTLSFTNEVKGCYILCNNGLVVAGIINGTGKCSTSYAGTSALITSSFNTYGKGIHRGSFQLNRTSPTFWIKWNAVEYPADDIVNTTINKIGATGGNGGNGGETTACAAPAAGGLGSSGTSGGPYGGGHTGAGGNGANIDGAGSDAVDAGYTANGTIGAVGITGGVCTGAGGLNIFTWGRYIDMKSGSSIISNGSNGANGASGSDDASGGGGGSGGCGAGSVCRISILPLVDNATTTLTGGTKGIGGTANLEQPGFDGTAGSNGTETNLQVIL